LFCRKASFIEGTCAGPIRGSTARSERGESAGCAVTTLSTYSETFEAASVDSQNPVSESEKSLQGDTMYEKLGYVTTNVMMRKTMKPQGD
jgi:hypothetical protein